MALNEQLNSTPQNLYLLYENDDLFIVPDSNTEPAISYEGKNNYQTVIVSENISAVDKELLDKILSALGLLPDAVKQIDLAHLQLNENTIVDELAEKGKLVLFGIGLDKLQIAATIGLYAPYNYKGYNLLLADSLAHIGAHVEAKKQLWGALQQMYKV